MLWLFSYNQTTIKKYLYISLLALTAFICQLTCLYLVFRSAEVQTWLAGKATSYLSSELSTTVKVGGVDIAWFLDVELEDVLIEDQNKKILLKTSSLELEVNRINLAQKQLLLKSILLEGAEVNLTKYKSDSTFNYAFLIDYFSGKSPDTTIKEPWRISIEGINLKSSNFNYHNFNKGYNTKSMDYDHLEISGINLDARRILIQGDSIMVKIKDLSARERSGFVLDKLAGNVVINPKKVSIEDLHILTAESNLNGKIKFTYNNFNALNSFIDSVNIEAFFQPSTLQLEDIKYFTSSMVGMENLINFDGTIKGRISSLKARDFNFSFGNNSAFSGEISMDGLPDIQETFIHLNVTNLTTDYNDIANINLPGRKNISLPKEIKEVGLIDINGFFTGFIYDFVSSADFYTKLGRLETDISLQTGQGSILKYNGQFNLKNWNLGQNFNIPDKLGTIDLTSSLSGEILQNKKNNVHLDALIQRITFLGNDFNDIAVNGVLDDKLFNGSLKLKDELVNLDFKGLMDFSQKVPRMNFTASLEDAYLSKLNLWERDSTSRISTKMDLNFTGSNIDNLMGYLRFDSTSYYEKGKAYYLENVELAMAEINHQSKKLSLVSDIANASFYGKFSYADFLKSLTNIMYSYLPSLQKNPIKQNDIKDNQLFEYNLQIKDFAPITELFIPDLILETEAVLFGHYNSAQNNIVLNGMADEFWYQGVKFEHWYIKGKNTGNSLQFVSGVSSLVLDEPDETSKGEIGVENLIFKVMMKGDSIKYDLSWDDNIAENYNVGHVIGHFSFDQAPYIHGKFDNVDLVINKVGWRAIQENDFIIDSTSVTIDRIDILSKGQKLKLSGKISEDPNDIFAVNFENVDISNADRLISVKGLDFDGVLNGLVTIRDVYKTQRLESAIEIKDFAFNKERMGDATIYSNWNQSIAALDIKVDILYQGNYSSHLPISAKGLIYPAKRDEGNFDLDIDVSNYKLASLNPFLKGIASNIKGFANGKLKLEGTFDKPVITGGLDLVRTQMKIDYLNVTYSFADNVTIEPGLIKADNVAIYDSLGNSGRCDFTLKHDHFRKIDMNIDLYANNMNGLNTTYKNNNLFYGTAFGSGNVNIKGSFSDIGIKINVESKPNTNIYIPINLALGASENSFIRFLTKEQTGQPTPFLYLAKTTGTSVDMNLDVTKDASIQLFLPENIGNIKATGYGNIQMGVSKQGDFSIYGDYTMDEGKFLFTLGNVINREFTIQNGSNLSFNGSPYDADISLSAVYHLKASLRGLPETSEYSGMTVPVDCIIRLKDDLYSPEISFSISLPEADNSLNQLVFASIDTTNQVIMTEQIVSLLVLKTFAFNSAPNLATSVSSSSIEVLTDQLSNLLSQLSDGVDIGVKYRSGALADEEVEVALSTNFFNNRVSVDGNLGIYTTNTSQNTNDIVGDVIVDVKITPDGRFRVKGFNKSQRFDISSLEDNQDKYKQGIGIYYRYEFDKISEILRRKRLLPSSNKQVNP